MTKSNSPLISVVIPTYNHAHFLREALQSVVNQTYSRWEVIVIDNYSNDNSDAIVNAHKDSRIRLLKIHNNGIIAASRNLGISKSNGDWIAFLDSDDSWYPTKLEVIVAAIQRHPAIDVLCTNSLLVNTITRKNRVLIYGPFDSNFYGKLLLEGNRLAPSATVVRRGFLVKTMISFREDRSFVTAEDYDFWLLLARAQAKFDFIPSIQSLYVVHASNSSSKVKLHTENTLNVLRDHVYQLQTFASNRDEIWKQVYARHLLMLAKNDFIDRNYFSALLQIFQSVSAAPVFSLRCTSRALQRRFHAAVFSVTFDRSSMR